MRRNTISTHGPVQECFFAADFQAIQLEERQLLDGNTTDPNNPPADNNAPTTPGVNAALAANQRMLTGTAVTNLLHLTAGMNYHVPGWAGDAPVSGPQLDVYFAAYVDYVKANPGYDPMNGGAGDPAGAFPGWTGSDPGQMSLQSDRDVYNSAYGQYLSGLAAGTGTPSATTARALSGSALKTLFPYAAMPGMNYTLPGWVGTPASEAQTDLYFTAFVDYNKSHPGASASGGMGGMGGMQSPEAFPGSPMPKPGAGDDPSVVDAYNEAYAGYLSGYLTDFQTRYAASPASSRPVTGTVLSDLFSLTPGSSMAGSGYVLPGWLGNAPTAGRVDAYFAAYMDYVQTHPEFDPQSTGMGGTGNTPVTPFDGWLGELPSTANQGAVDGYNDAYMAYLAYLAGRTVADGVYRNLTGTLLQSLFQKTPGMGYSLPGWLGGTVPTTAGSALDAYFVAHMNYLVGNPGASGMTGGMTGSATAFPGWIGEIPSTSDQAEVDRYNEAYMDYLADLAAAAVDAPGGEPATPPADPPAPIDSTPPPFVPELPTSWGGASDTVGGSSYTAYVGRPLVIHDTHLANIATDLGGGTPVVALLHGPEHGSLVASSASAELMQNGLFSYTANTRFNGIDNLLYSVTVNGKTVYRTVSIQVQAPPSEGDSAAGASADDRVFHVFHGHKLQIAAGDLAALNGHDSTGVTYTLHTSPTRGAFDLNQDTGAFTYEPDKTTDTDTVTFSYTLSYRKADGTLLDDTATVFTVTIKVDDAKPQAADRVIFVGGIKDGLSDERVADTHHYILSGAQLADNNPTPTGWRLTSELTPEIFALNGTRPHEGWVGDPDGDLYDIELQGTQPGVRVVGGAIEIWNADNSPTWGDAPITVHYRLKEKDTGLCSDWATVTAYNPVHSPPSESANGDPIRVTAPEEFAPVDMEFWQMGQRRTGSVHQMTAVPQGGSLFYPSMSVGDIALLTDPSLPNCGQRNISFSSNFFSLGELKQSTEGLWFEAGAKASGTCWFAFTTGSYVSDPSILEPFTSYQVRIRVTGPCTINLQPIEDAQVEDSAEPTVEPMGMAVTHNGSLIVDWQDGVLAMEGDMDDGADNPFDLVDGTGVQLTGDGPAHADQFTLSATGAFSYIPVKDYVGMDSFTFTYTRVDGTVVEGQINIEVQNATPEASGVAIQTTRGTPVLLTHDSGLTVAGGSDADSQDTLRVSNLAGFVNASGAWQALTGEAIHDNTLTSRHLAHGYLTVAESGTVLYTPDANFTGTEVIGYRLTDGLSPSGSNIGLLVITVSPPVSETGPSAIQAAASTRDTSIATAAAARDGAVDAADAVLATKTQAADQAQSEAQTQAAATRDQANADAQAAFDAEQASLASALQTASDQSQAQLQADSDAITAGLTSQIAALQAVRDGIVAQAAADRDAAEDQTAALAVYDAAVAAADLQLASDQAAAEAAAQQALDDAQAANEARIASAESDHQAELQTASEAKAQAEGEALASYNQALADAAQARSDAMYLAQTEHDGAVTQALNGYQAAMQTANSAYTSAAITLAPDSANPLLSTLHGADPVATQRWLDAAVAADQLANERLKADLKPLTDDLQTAPPPEAATARQALAAAAAAQLQASRDAADAYRNAVLAAADAVRTDATGAAITDTNHLESAELAATNILKDKLAEYNTELANRQKALTDQLNGTLDGLESDYQASLNGIQSGLDAQVATLQNTYHGVVAQAVQTRDAALAALGGGAGFVPMSPARTAAFDGTGLICLPNAADTSLTDVSQRTVSLWFKPDASNMAGRHVLYEEGDAVSGLNVYLDNGRLVVGAWSNADGSDSSAPSWSQFITSATVVRGDWNHAGLVLNADGGTLTGYLNGRSIGWSGAGVVAAHAGPAGIGGVNGTTRFTDGVSTQTGAEALYKGGLADLRIYGTDQSVAMVPRADIAGSGILASLVSVAANPGSAELGPAGYVARYTFQMGRPAGTDETGAHSGVALAATEVAAMPGGAWGSVGDTVPNSNFGGITQAATVATATAAHFDGGGLICLPNSQATNLSQTSQRTISLWFKADAASLTGKHVLYEEGDASNGLNLYLDNGQLVAGAWGSARDSSMYGSSMPWTSFITATPQVDGNWNHAALVFNNNGGYMGMGAGGLSVCLNGQSFSNSADYVYTLPIHADPAGLGGINGTTRVNSMEPAEATSAATNFVGSLADVRIYCTDELEHMPVLSDMASIVAAPGTADAGPANYEARYTFQPDRAVGADETGRHDGEALSTEYVVAKAGWGYAGDTLNSSSTSASAASFDGTGLICLPNSAGTNAAATTQRTISLWFKADAASLTGKHVLYEEGGDATGLNIYLDNGHLVAGGWNNAMNGSMTWSSYITSASQVSANWNHVALVLNADGGSTGGMLKAYLNGQVINTQNSDASCMPAYALPSHTDPVGLGGINGTTRFNDGMYPTCSTGADTNFIGSLADVRIYNADMSAQIGILAVPGRMGEASPAVGGYEARYAFQPGHPAGTDATGQHNGFALSTEYVAGRSGWGYAGDPIPGTSGGGGGGDTTGDNTVQAAHFDGSGLICLPSDNALNLADVSQRTISLWFKADAASLTGRHVLYEEGGYARGLNLYLDNGQVVAGGWNTDFDTETQWSAFLSSMSGVDCNWHHVALVLSADGMGGTLSAYLDGQSLGSASAGVVQSHYDPIGLGGINSSTRFTDGHFGIGFGAEAVTATNFIGSLADVRIYNSDQSSTIAALSAAASIGAAAGTPDAGPAGYEARYAFQTDQPVGTDETGLHNGTAMSTEYMAYWGGWGSGWETAPDGSFNGVSGGGGTGGGGSSGSTPPDANFNGIVTTTVDGVAPDTGFTGIAAGAIPHDANGSIPDTVVETGIVTYVRDIVAATDFYDLTMAKAETDLQQALAAAQQAVADARNWTLWNHQSKKQAAQAAYESAMQTASAEQAQLAINAMEAYAGAVVAARETHAGNLATGMDTLAAALQTAKAEYEGKIAAAVNAEAALFDDILAQYGTDIDADEAKRKQDILDAHDQHTTDVHTAEEALLHAREIAVGAYQTALNTAQGGLASRESAAWQAYQQAMIRATTITPGTPVDQAAVQADLLQRQFNVDVDQWDKAKDIAEDYQAATTAAHKQVATDYATANATLWSALQTYEGVVASVRLEKQKRADKDAEDWAEDNRKAEELFRQTGETDISDYNGQVEILEDLLDDVRQYGGGDPEDPTSRFGLYMAQFHLVEQARGTYDGLRSGADSTRQSKLGLANSAHEGRLTENARLDALEDARIPPALATFQGALKAYLLATLDAQIGYYESQKDAVLDQQTASDANDLSAYIRNAREVANAVNESLRITDTTTVDQTAKAQAEADFAQAEQDAREWFEGQRTNARIALEGALGNGPGTARATYRANLVQADRDEVAAITTANSDAQQQEDARYQVALNAMLAVPHQKQLDVEQAAEEAIEPLTTQVETARAAWLKTVKDENAAMQKAWQDAGTTLQSDLHAAEEAYIGYASQAQSTYIDSLQDAFQSEVQAVIDPLDAATGMLGTYTTRQTAAAAQLNQATADAYCALLMNPIPNASAAQTATDTWLATLLGAAGLRQTDIEGATTAFHTTTQQLLAAQGAAVDPANLARNATDENNRTNAARARAKALIAQQEFADAMADLNDLMGLPTPTTTTVDFTPPSGADLTRVWDAVPALYASLTDAQTQRFLDVAAALAAYGDAQTLARSGQTDTSSADLLQAAEGAQGVDYANIAAWQTAAAADTGNRSPEDWSTLPELNRDTVTHLATLDDLQNLINRISCQPGSTGCFTGETTVATSRGRVRIDQLQLGDRVLTSMEGESQPSETEVDPQTWVKIDLTAQAQGTTYVLSILRSRDWLKDKKPGDQIKLHIEELDLKTQATITNVGPCPTVQEGPGRVVRMTIKHQHNDSLKLRLSSGEEITTTSQHPFWSPERKEFVKASELRVGSLVATRRVAVTSTGESEQEMLAIIGVERGAAAEVFNIEVEGEHWYFVGNDEVWVHNTYGILQPVVDLMQTALANLQRTYQERKDAQDQAKEEMDSKIEAMQDMRDDFNLNPLEVSRLQLSQLSQNAGRQWDATVAHWKNMSYAEMVSAAWKGFKAYQGGKVEGFWDAAKGFGSFAWNLSLRANPVTAGYMLFKDAANTKENFQTFAGMMKGLWRLAKMANKGDALGVIHDVVPSLYTVLTKPVGTEEWCAALGQLNGTIDFEILMAIATEGATLVVKSGRLAAGGKEVLSALGRIAGREAEMAPKLARIEQLEARLGQSGLTSAERAAAERELAEVSEGAAKTGRDAAADIAKKGDEGGAVDALGAHGPLGERPLGQILGTFDAANPGPLADDLAGTFAGGRYTEIILDQDVVMYRAGTKAKPLGQFFDLQPAESIIQARIDKAILPRWPNGGASPLDTLFKVKIPKGTRVYVGPVGTQNGIYVGGTRQIVVPTPWNIEGVKVLGNTPLK